MIQKTVTPPVPVEPLADDESEPLPRLVQTGLVSASSYESHPGAGLPATTPSRAGLAAKRMLDIAVSLTALLVCGPLMALLALVIRLDSPGPVLYIQDRVTENGRLFRLLKFRSMRVDAEETTGPVWAVPNDPRLTRIGRLMRRYSLDELPQFVNVLRGDMSVVGPRPERPYFVDQFRATVPNYMTRQSTKAGITGWAQIHGLRGNTSIEERTRYDLHYVMHRSILLDLRIMALTITRMFHDDNAY